MDALQIKPRALAGGIASMLPGIRAFTCRGSGGTCSSRYCYSVWLRHLVRAHESGLRTSFQSVAELGPGDSIGMGLAAMLSGADRYIALDIKAHADPETNLRIFDELLELFHARAPIPDDVEFPMMQPKLARYDFPRHLLEDGQLGSSLGAARVKEIRSAITGRGAAIDISYVAPWYDASIVQQDSVEFLFSQAVLEHVDDLDAAYAAMQRSLKPGGFMSHSIDFSSHNVTRSWNGHWTLSDNAWRLVRGGRPYLINRQPLSHHLRLLAQYGFEVVNVESRRGVVAKSFRPARRFRELSNDDVSTKGAFVQARAGRRPRDREAVPAAR
jgi:methyltransferase family protein